MPYIAIPVGVVAIYLIFCTCRICCRWQRHRRQNRQRNANTRNHGNNVDEDQTENRDETHGNTVEARAEHQNVQSSDPSAAPPSYTTLNTPETHPPSYEELFKSSENTVVQAARLDR